MTIKSMLTSFLGETTLHGIRYVVLEQAATVRKLLWLAVVMTSVSAFLFTLVNTILDYYKFETDIRINVKHPGQCARQVQCHNYGKFSLNYCLSVFILTALVEVRFVAVNVIDIGLSWTLLTYSRCRLQVLSRCSPSQSVTSTRVGCRCSRDARHHNL